MSKQIYDKKIDIYEGINSRLINFIEHGKTVLDVGCGTGMLGEYLIKNKNCIVFGVDISPKAIIRAKSRLNDAYVFDIETDDFIYSKKFDYIIFGDVLEHLRYPNLILNNYKNFLSQNGRILVSIPNVANIIVRLKLFFGKWDYRDHGILDNTHLRFFTYKTARRMFQEAELTVTNEGSIPGIYFSFTKKLKVLRWMNEFIGRLFPKLFATQFIFELKNDVL